MSAHPDCRQWLLTTVAQVGALVLIGLAACTQGVPQSPSTPAAVEVRETMPKPSRDERGPPAGAFPPAPVIPTTEEPIGRDVRVINRRGKIEVSIPEVEGKELDSDKLAAYLRSRSGALLQCYERQLKRSPELKGKLVVRFSITTAGRSTELGIEENSLEDEPLAICAMTTIRGWVFPFKPAVTTVVAAGFVFSARP